LSFFDREPLSVGFEREPLSVGFEREPLSIGFDREPLSVGFKMDGLCWALTRFLLIAEDSKKTDVWKDRI